MIPGWFDISCGRSTIRSRNSPIFGNKVRRPLRTQRKRRGRCAGHLARAQQFHQPVLDHFRVRGQAVERPLLQPVQHRVGDVPHPRLQRQQRSRKPALLHLQAQKLHDVRRNPLRVLVWRLELAGAVRRVGAHHRNHLLHRDLQIRLANPHAHRGQRDRVPMRRFAQAIEVVHPLQLHRLRRIDLQDHLLRALDPGQVIAHRRAGNHPPVLQHRRHLDQRQVQLAHETRTPQSVPPGSDACPCTASRPR